MDVHDVHPQIVMNNNVKFTMFWHNSCIYTTIYTPYLSATTKQSMSDANNDRPKKTLFVSLSVFLKFSIFKKLR